MIESDGEQDANAATNAQPATWPAIRCDTFVRSTASEVDGRVDGETIWQVAPQRHGIELPHLCYSPEPGYRADGNCRVCMVEIEGERVLAASCIRKPPPGMKVKTQTDRAKTARQMVFELLVTDQPSARRRARSAFEVLEARRSR